MHFNIEFVTDTPEQFLNFDKTQNVFFKIISRSNKLINLEICPESGCVSLIVNYSVNPNVLLHNVREILEASLNFT